LRIWLLHLRVGETQGHRRARRAGADDQHIDGIVHAGLSLIRRSMPRPPPEMQCGVSPAFLNFGILSERKISAQGKNRIQPE